MQLEFHDDLNDAITYKVRSSRPEAVPWPKIQKHLEIQPKLVQN